MADELTPDQATRGARRMAQVTIIAAVVVAAVVVIDLQIKKGILREASRAQAALYDFRQLVEKHTVTVEVSANGRAEAAGENGSVPGSDFNGPGGVVDDATAGAVLDPAAGAAEPAQPVRKARAPRRAQGNG